MEAIRNNISNWQKAPSQIFWGEIAPCEHVVQIYENDEVFLDLLAGFVHGGITTDESSVVIATAKHLDGLKCRLESMGVDCTYLIRTQQYIPLVAEEILARFMVNDWPDENLFMTAIAEVIQTAKKDGRRVRAFGEMVAILWAQGHIGATVRLEHLWNKFCESEAFCLFCAYPKNGFTQDAETSLMHICSAHTKMVTGSTDILNNVLYKEISFHKG
jgi:hypothetical protein